MPLIRQIRQIRRATVTDGRRHDVVAVAGAKDLRLYLDGAEMVARSVSPGDPGSGRWWLGGGSRRGSSPPTADVAEPQLGLPGDD
jgi:hypothetical protein